MRFKSTTFVLAATLALAASSPVFADEVDINLTGWQTFGDFGDASNSNTTVNIGAGSLVTGAEWINLGFVAHDPSWRSELVLSLNTSDLSSWFDSTVSADDSPGSYSGSGTFPGPGSSGGPFSVLADGDLYIETYEAFDDPEVSPNATISGGTLRVFYTTIPEPSSLGLLGVGTLFLLQRRVRRRP